MEGCNIMVICYVDDGRLQYNGLKVMWFQYREY